MTTGLTAQSVAELVGGHLRGPGTIQLLRVAALDRAGPDALSMLCSARYLGDFRRSRAGAVVVSQDLADEPEGPATRIVVPDAAGAMGIISGRFDYPQGTAPGIHPSAILGPGVRLDDQVSIGPHAVVGRDVRVGSRSVIGAGVVIEDAVVVGADVVLGPRVVLCQGTELGDRVVVQAGAVVGGVGFGFRASVEGQTRLPHVGRCILENDVEIGSNTCIDRGSVDDTIVGQGTKIDNLVQIAHNVRIGRHCFIAAEVGISGSCHIGDEVMIAGQVGISGHVTVEDGARLSAQSGVIGNVPPGADYGGTPARPHRHHMRGQAALFRLSRILKQLEALVAERGQGD